MEWGIILLLEYKVLSVFDSETFKRDTLKSFSFPPEIILDSMFEKKKKVENNSQNPSTNISYSNIARYTVDIIIF